jgi:hypothetical protein
VSVWPCHRLFPYTYLNLWYTWYLWGHSFKEFGAGHGGLEKILEIKRHIEKWVVRTGDKSYESCTVCCGFWQGKPGWYPLNARRAAQGHTEGLNQLPHCQVQSLTMLIQNGFVKIKRKALQCELWLWANFFSKDHSISYPEKSVQTVFSYWQDSKVSSGWLTACSHKKSVLIGGDHWRVKDWFAQWGKYSRIFFSIMSSFLDEEGSQLKEQFGNHVGSKSCMQGSG